jgi:hypothetical protein
MLMLQLHHLALLQILHALLQAALHAILHHAAHCCCQHQQPLPPQQQHCQALVLELQLHLQR